MNIINMDVDIDILVSHFLKQHPELNKYFESVTLSDIKKVDNNTYLVFNYVAKSNKISMRIFTIFENKFNEYVGNNYIIYFLCKSRKSHDYIRTSSLLFNDHELFSLNLRVVTANNKLTEIYNSVSKKKMKSTDFHNLCRLLQYLLKELKIYNRCTGINNLRELDKYINTLDLYSRRCNRTHKDVLCNTIENDLPYLLKHIKYAYR